MLQHLFPGTQVRRKSRDFLANITTIRKYGNFLNNSILCGRASFRHTRQIFLQPFGESLGEVLGQRYNLLVQPAQVFDQFKQVRLGGLTFRRTHVHQTSECGGNRIAQQCLQPFGSDLPALTEYQVLDIHQISQADIDRQSGFPVKFLDEPAVAPGQGHIQLQYQRLIVFRVQIDGAVDLPPATAGFNDLLQRLLDGSQPGGAPEPNFQKTIVH